MICVILYIDCGSLGKRGCFVFVKGYAKIKKSACVYTDGYVTLKIDAILNVTVHQEKVDYFIDNFKTKFIKSCGIFFY